VNKNPSPKGGEPPHLKQPTRSWWMMYFDLSRGEELTTHPLKPLVGHLPVLTWRTIENNTNGKLEQSISELVNMMKKSAYKFDKARLHICALQEVRRLNQRSAIVACQRYDYSNKYEIHWSGNSLKRHHGVGHQDWPKYWSDSSWIR